MKARTILRSEICGEEPVTIVEQGADCCLDEESEEVMVVLCLAAVAARLMHAVAASL